jgi:hypothetical protein
MRRGITLVSLIIAMLAPSAAFAQLSRERVKISNVRLGFPFSGGSGVRGGLFKPGQWAPVYVDLECVRDTDPDENLLLIVETKDADEAVTEGAVEIPAMKKEDRVRGNELGRIPYLMPGSEFASVTVRVKGVKSGRTYGELSDRTFSGVATPAFVVLGIGTNLNGLRFPETVKGQDDGPMTRGGWIQSGRILDVGELPDQWFGYGAVDLIVVGTGTDRSFWETLGAPQHAKRRTALAEWVRRGGRMVVSVGTNPDVLEAIKELKDILPAVVPPGGKRMEQSLVFHWQVEGVRNQRSEPIPMPGGEFAVARLEPKPDRPTKIVLSEDVGGTRPLAVQGAHGLGRVTVFGFDLDRLPFSEWGKRAQFWENLVNQTGYVLPPIGKLERYGSTRYDEFSASLQGSLDFFEGIPVVSFGWVALFILIYIILIGPVDYLFLKKVIRRLEWTWVTFPVIVITVSAAAYFAAYALKGKDLKINKLDVVDIDLAGKRVDGNTWFTLFSPRIQNYTIGVEPAGGAGGDAALPRWVPGEASDAARETVMSWHAHVEANRYSGGRGGTFFSKHYRYQSGIDPVDPNHDLYASGLEGVPIQVWTTKAFHAEWTAPIDPMQPPVKADLWVSPTDDHQLIGTVTSNLPAEEFTEIALIWRGQVFTLSDFLNGVPKAVGFSAKAGSEKPVKTWVQSVSNWTPRTQTSYSGFGDQGTPSNPRFALWPVLFSDYVADTYRVQTPNASLRRLDQSWRINPDRPEQAILVLRMPTREGPAEAMTRSGSSPSRLWLGELPTAGGRRPAVNGTLKQETYVRVFIPVRTKKQ